MTYMKKILTVLVAAIMVMAMAIPAMATTEKTTGSIKISNATKGQTYTAYKIFNATANGTAVAYTTDITGKGVIDTANAESSTVKAPFTVAETANAAGEYAVTKKTDASDVEVIAWVSANYSSFSSTGKTDGTFDADAGTYIIGDLDLGYYYVTSSLGSVISIDTVTGTDKEIKDKNTQGPNTPRKIIKDTTEKTSDDANVGSTETFQVTYNATNWVTKGEGNDVTTTKVEKFYIKDTPTGMTIDESSVAIKVNGSEITDGFTKAVNGTTGVLSIEIAWVDASGNFKYQASGNDENIPVEVTYNATITASAAAAVAPNKVEITYSHEGVSTSEYVTDPQNPPHTDTYTYKFQLNKTDGTDSLAGAKFELFDGETKVSFIADGAVYRVAAAGETGTVTEIDMTTDTTVEIKGLDNKNYTLKETKAPDGYTLADEIIIGATNTNETNKLVRVDATTYDDSSTGKITVVNRAGSVLPSTGGMGTTIFYVLGAILVLAAGIALVTRRRMNAR